MSSNFLFETYPLFGTDFETIVFDSIEHATTWFYCNYNQLYDILLKELKSKTTSEKFIEYFKETHSKLFTKITNYLDCQISIENNEKSREEYKKCFKNIEDYVDFVGLDFYQVLQFKIK